MAPLQNLYESATRKTVVANPAAADQWLLDFVCYAAQSAVAKQGHFSMALSGGSSPLNFYRLLAALPQADANSTGFPWDKTHIWIVDERFVPIDHKDHNGAAIQAIFCGSSAIAAPLAASHLHLIDTGVSTPAQAVEKYAADLSKHFPKDKLPRIDFMLLGMGGDGHTASLFPGTGAIDVKDTTVLTCKPLTAPHERVSLTLPVLNAVQDAVFLICGESKKEMLAKVLSKADTDFPASMVNPAQGRVVFLCDEAAAR